MVGRDRSRQPQFTVIGVSRTAGGSVRPNSYSICSFVPAGLAATKASRASTDRRGLGRALGLAARKDIVGPALWSDATDRTITSVNPSSRTNARMSSFASQ